MSELGATTETQFIQSRVALVGKTVAALTLVGCAANVAFNPIEHLSRPPFWMLLATAAVWTAQWLLCSGRPRSRSFVLSIEWVSMLTVALSAGGMARFIVTEFTGLFRATYAESPAGFAAFVAVAEKQVAVATIMGLGFAVVLRSALVPTRPSNSVALSFAVGTCLFGAFLLPDHLFELDVERALMPDIGLYVEILIWWLLTTLVVWALSRVIHGLRQEVREARQLGPYQLEGKLGAGGMGVVYRAKHALMRRPTAIKLLPPGETSPAHLLRFEREVQLTARLTHPNTITVFDYGRAPDGVFYYAMELLEGATLDRVVRHAGRLPPARVVHVLRAVAGALAEAHAIGLVHRDIKPSNVMLCRQGGFYDVPKLLDFGLVRELNADPNSGITQAHAITGTPMYMAPEAATDPESVDARSDLYALGAVGYFMLTGSEVFSGKTIVEVLGKHLYSEPERPSTRIGSELPAELERLILDCLEKSPERRPPSAASILERLEACTGLGTWSPREAESWWRGAGAELVSGDESAQTMGTETLAVELNR